MSIPDFHQTGHLLLSNVFLMHHLLVQLLSMSGYYYSDLTMALGAEVFVLMRYLLTIAYIWFGPSFREPPDKFVPFSSTSEGDDNGNENRASCFDTKLCIHDPREVLSVTPTCVQCLFDFSL